MSYMLLNELWLIKRLALKERALDAHIKSATRLDTPDAWAQAEAAAQETDDLKAQLAAVCD